MQLSHNLYLIGPAGAGKSCIGRVVARLLSVPHVDSDSEIEREAGVSISWIFAKEQEAGFRQREERMIDRLCRQRPIVLSTGGGAVLSAKNRHLLSSTGLVVLLSVSLEEQVRRVSSHASKRPLLVDSPEQVLAEMNAERAHWYRSIANVVMHTDHKTAHMVAHDIVGWYSGQYA